MLPRHLISSTRGVAVLFSPPGCISTRRCTHRFCDIILQAQAPTSFVFSIKALLQFTHALFLPMRLQVYLLLLRSNAGLCSSATSGRTIRMSESSDSSSFWASFFDWDSFLASLCNLLRSAFVSARYSLQFDI